MASQARYTSQFETSVLCKAYSLESSSNLICAVAEVEMHDRGDSWAENENDKSSGSEFSEERQQLNASRTTAKITE